MNKNKRRTKYNAEVQGWSLGAITMFERGFTFTRVVVGTQFRGGQIYHGECLRVKDFSSYCLPYLGFIKRVKIKLNVKNTL